MTDNKVRAAAQANAPSAEQPTRQRLLDLAEVAWGVIANANNGDWDSAAPTWRVAAERWRTEYFRTLDALVAIEPSASAASGEPTARRAFIEGAAWREFDFDPSDGTPWLLRAKEEAARRYGHPAIESSSAASAGGGEERA